MTTWVSDGPYWLSRVAPGRRAQSSAIGGVIRSASPAVTTERREPGSAGSSRAASASCSSATNGRKSRSTRWRAAIRQRARGSRRSSSGTRTRVPPAVRVPRISWNETSKESGANCRVAGAPGVRSACQASSWASAPRPSATPLGRPVEPEV